MSGARAIECCGLRASGWSLLACLSRKAVECYESRGPRLTKVTASYALSTIITDRQQLSHRQEIRSAVYCITSQSVL